MEKYKYREDQKIGSGSYGDVYRGKHILSETTVALKKIYLDPENEGLPSAIVREISLLKQLQHKNIVRLLDLVHTEKKLFLVFESMEQDLKSFLEPYGKGKNRLNPDHIKKLMFQLLLAVEHCHFHRVLHRDLKSANILINKSPLHLKLADFGLARTYGIPVRAYTQEVVTLWYRPPEILLGATQYSTEVDVWSVGCIFAEIANATSLFKGDNEAMQLDCIFSLLGVPDIKMWPGFSDLPGSEEAMRRHGASRNSSQPARTQKEALEHAVEGLDADGIDLLSRMLHYDPSKRISAAEALAHPYFKKVAEAEAEEEEERKEEEKRNKKKKKKN